MYDHVIKNSLSLSTLTPRLCCANSTDPPCKPHYLARLFAPRLNRALGVPLHLRCTLLQHIATRSHLRTQAVTWPFSQHVNQPTTLSCCSPHSLWHALVLLLFLGFCHFLLQLFHVRIIIICCCDRCTNLRTQTWYKQLNKILYCIYVNIHIQLYESNTAIYVYNWIQMYVCKYRICLYMWVQRTQISFCKLVGAITYMNHLHIHTSTPVWLNSIWLDTLLQCRYVYILIHLFWVHTLMYHCN